MSGVVNNRYDFVFLFDVKDGNPNGDPDAGNLPRIDPETGHGLVTDVCLKRKVRNYVQLAKEFKIPFDIYVKEKAVLGDAHFKAFKEYDIRLGEESKTEITKEIYDLLDENGVPEGLSIDVDEDNNKYTLFVSAVADKKEIKEWLKEANFGKAPTDVINGALKGTKSRRPSGDEVEKGREKMCQDYYDIRTFGGVLSLKTAPNCGQVRGPVQLTFARSVDQILPLEHSITRMAVATQAEADKQKGDNRTMGRKFTVPYALYLCHGFISAPLAAQTGFSEDDLDLFWNALKEMFEHDRSAARGEMTMRKIVAFKHQSALGNAPANRLFERVKVSRKDKEKPPRAFDDYEISINDDSLPQNVELIDMI